jgi:hypothetical protein
MTHDELLKQAREHWEECSTDEAEVENRIRGREDARFAAGLQWDERTKHERDIVRRPALVFNRMPGFLHQVENEVRRNKIAIKISPVDAGIDQDTAAVDQGLIRQIQYNSEADTDLHAAFVEACRSGLGAFCLRAEYVSDDSFDQELKIRQIPNAITRCFFDPFAKRVDRADARYAFEVDVLAKEEFKRQFPKSNTSTTSFFDGVPFAHDWIQEDGVRVANYWYRETKRRKLLLLQSGQSVFADDAGPLPPGVTVLREREVMTAIVKCAKLNGEEVLDEYDWPGSSIPIFFVVGEELWVDEKRKRFSLIHFAKDGQRLLNFYRSAEAEVISLAPKAPFIVAEGQIEGYEREWATANLVNYAVLPYKPTSINGVPIAPPTRNTWEPPIQAISLGAAQVIDEMKAATGIYDASLGARSNETSGVAIQQRQAEGDLANFHFIDNLSRAIAACGRAIVEVKPHYYDTARTIQILGEDEKERVVRVNEQYVDENGVPRHYKISDSKYNVRVASGPNYTTARQEAWAALTEFGRSWPQLYQIAGDVIFRASDMPGADQIADRIEKTLPPELAADDEKKGGPQQLPPQVQAQMQALSQQNAQLTQAVNTLSDDLKTNRLEIESKERIAALNAQVKLIDIHAKVSSQEAAEMLRAELAAIKDRLALLHVQETVEDDAANAAPNAPQPPPPGAIAPQPAAAAPA